MVRWNFFYGSFAATIIFIIWTSLNWMAILFGEEFLCVWQNKLYHKTARFGKSFLFDLGYLLLILKEIYNDFSRKGEGMTPAKIAKKLLFNTDDVKRILLLFENEGILLSENYPEKRYFLRKNVASVKLRSIEEMVWENLYLHNYQKSDELKKICMNIGKSYLNEKNSSRVALAKLLKE